MITMYAWPSTADGPDALPMVHFTTDEQSGGEVSEEGMPIWLFDTAIREGGWSAFEDFEGWSAPAEGWQAFYRREDDVLAVTGPGACEGWYQGRLGADDEWIKAAATQNSVVLLAAPVQHPSLYAYAVEAGAGFALLAPLVVI